jgi:hypothetical protein
VRKAKAPEFHLEHLSGAVKEAAMLSDDVRKDLIQRDRWIGYPRSIEISEKLKGLMNHPIRQRMPNLLIVGPTNNGKSKVIQRFIAQCTPTVAPTDRIYLPVLLIEMPPEPSSSRLYATIMHTLNAPLRQHARTLELEHTVVKLLRELEVRMVIVDEIHNLLAGSARQQRVVLNQLKFLGNQLRIPLVGVGTGDAWHAIKNDAQLANRFEPVTLPLWELNEDLLALLASFGKLFPLRERSFLADERIAELVLSRTDRTIGEITALMETAAIRAIDTGVECLTYDVVAETNYQSPNERRMRLDQTLR